MHSSGLFALMAQKIIDDKEGPSVVTHYLFVFARMLLQDPSTFLQLINATAVAKNVKEEIIINGLMDQWRGKVSVVADGSVSLLIALSMTTSRNSGTANSLHLVLRLSSEQVTQWSLIAWVPIYLIYGWKPLAFLKNRYRLLLKSSKLLHATFRIVLTYFFPTANP